MDDDFLDKLPYPLNLKAGDPETYREITRMREAAEAEHGKDTIERASRTYVEMRVELIERPLASGRKAEFAGADAPP